MNPRLRAAIDRTRRWIVPGGLLFLCAVIWLRLDPGSPILEAAVRGYPWAIYGAGLLVAWRFRRSRVAAAIVAVAAVQSGTDLLPGSARPAFVGAAAVLAPILFGVLAPLRDRPTLSLRGAAASGLAVLLLGGAAAASLRWPGELATLLARPVELPAVGWAPVPSILAAALGGAAVAGVTVRRGGAGERGLLWALAALVLALHADPGRPAFGVHLLTAGLILVVAVVEGSYALAYQDELTGLPSRRALEQELDRLGRRYTVAMVDVDHFKRFNDEHGHDVGDQVLRMVAARLRAAAGGGRAYRYGGEEVTLLYPGKSPDEVRSHLEAVRESVEGARFTVRGAGRRRKGRRARGEGSSRKRKKLSVTVSVGAAEPTSRDEPPRAVLERADEALYRAKRNGRNRVEAA